MTEKRAFEFLLNAMENAAQQENPADHGYADKRRAVLKYVADLEAALSAHTQQSSDARADSDANWKLAANVAHQRAEALQAKLDALMLEYCPDEMTPEQVENWKRHQFAVTPEQEAALDRAIATLPQSGKGEG